MIAETITGKNINKNTAINMGKILTNKLFKYKNVAVNVVLNSPLHACIRMTDMQTGNNETICVINVFDHGYSITRSKNIRSIYILDYSDSIIPPIITIHKWLKKIIKDYRNN